MNSLSNRAFCSSGRTSTVESLNPYRRSLVAREKKGCGTFFSSTASSKDWHAKKKRR